MKSRIFAGLKTTTGVLLSGIAAIAAALGFSGTPVRFWLPWVFAGVLIVLASRYGASVALFGSLIAAFVFARFMFLPTGSFEIQDEGARSSLAWMILIATAGSYLMFPQQPNPTQRR